jgi:tRNA threonylcarbamoyladenosine modification (KEOPS) complex Cgi121 subunit
MTAARRDPAVSMLCCSLNSEYTAATCFVVMIAFCAAVRAVSSSSNVLRYNDLFSFYTVLQFEQ